MALSGTKAQEATLGQYGSIFVNANDTITPPSDYVICAITFLTDSTFHTTNGLVPENNAAEKAVFIKTATTTAGNGVAAANAAGSHAANAGEEGDGGDVITDATVFPKGVTIFGRFTQVIHVTGSFICYLAPSH
tara:strand:- start:1210 stop:1611 length:402 start_codon:yes stop_codon:yes gene_type:complete